MASGKSNYFRHHVRSHEHESLQILIKNFGVHGYYAYFVLMERCAELIIEGKEFPLRFSEQSLRKSLKFSKKKLKSFLEVSEKFLGICSETSENFIEISWPKSLKYLGSYFKNAPKESKVKESKVKESIIKEKIIKKSENFEKPKKRKKQATEEKIKVEDFSDLMQIVPDGCKERWKEKYPDEAWLKSEIEEAIFWNLNSPKGKPRTKSGWVCFVNNWLKNSKAPTYGQRTFQQMKTENNKKVFVELTDWAKGLS